MIRLQPDSPECTPENPVSTIRYRFVRSDGRAIWLEKNAKGFFDDKGKLLRVVSVIADISDRNKGGAVTSRQ